jgi:cell wall assembly regulator SMI1
LEAALANYDAFRDDRRWNVDWLPVFANCGGDFLAVTCSARPDNRGQVIHFRIDESEHPVEFVSVSCMLETEAAAYGEHVYFIEPTAI